ncbi:hypothetical protein LguiA_019260 [Lonicera macranthoides]
MVDLQIVCSMCGDVGFPDKLFLCSKCHNRSQHSYCSNYYSESSEPIELCDWCQRDERNIKHSGVTSKKLLAGNVAGGGDRSECSGNKILKQHDRPEEISSEKGKNPATGVPSPRRRYKLLKDVMC